MFRWKEVVERSSEDAVEWNFLTLERETHSMRASQSCRNEPNSKQVRPFHGSTAQMSGNLTRRREGDYKQVRHKDG